MTSDNKYNGPVKKATIIEKDSYETIRFYQYDRDGFLKEFTADDGKYILQYKNGLKFKESWYTIPENELQGVKEFEYNVKRQLVRTMYHSRYGSSCTIYLYDKKNRIIKESIYELKECKEILIQETEYIYCYTGQIAKVIRRKSNLEAKTRYTYDEDGILIRKHEYDYDGNLMKEIDFYHINGQISQIISTVPNGDHYKTFTYDNRENCIKEEINMPPYDNKITIRRLFDSFNNCIQETYFRQDNLCPYRDIQTKIEYF